MKNLNEVMNEAISNGNLNQIERIALNPKSALIKVYEYNFDYNQGGFVNKWIDIQEVNKDYFDCLSSDEKDYVQQLDKYSHLDYDEVIKQYDLDVLPAVIKRERALGWDVDDQGNLIGFLKDNKSNTDES